MRMHVAVVLNREAGDVTYDAAYSRLLIMLEIFVFVYCEYLLYVVIIIVCLDLLLFV